MESVPSPRDDIVLEFLMSQKRETSELDFKLILNTGKDSDFAKIAKDILAMSNYGGGYLVIGFMERKTGGFDPVGLPSSYHVDQAELQQKFNSYSSDPLEIGYSEFEKEIEGEKRKFAVIYAPPSVSVLKAAKHGWYTEGVGRVKRVFSKGDILIRRGTQSIPASPNEIKFIEKRASESEYKIGLLSGNPDNVSETLYGNFFEVQQMPSWIFEAEIPRSIWLPASEIRDTAFIRPAERIYSFCDLSKEPFGRHIKNASLCRHEVADFLKSEDRSNLLTQLLNSEIRSAALKRGLKFDPRDKNVYFYPTNEPVRRETWGGRSKKSTRIVAWKVYVKELKQSLFAHHAANASFESIGAVFFLRILPVIVLTHNGYDTIQSFREGTVKTRLSYNWYNDIYLNHVLFWASRFMSVGKKVIDFSGRILVSPTPAAVELGVGIRSDRPSGEFSLRERELSIYEDVGVR